MQNINTETSTNNQPFEANLYLSIDKVSGKPENFQKALRTLVQKVMHHFLAFMAGDARSRVVGKVCT